MSSKLREAASRLVREIEDGMLVELSSKFEYDLAQALLADVKSALAEPICNYEVGTVREQEKRLLSEVESGKVKLKGTIAEIIFKWSRMPYKKEGEE